MNEFHRAGKRKKQAAFRPGSLAGRQKEERPKTLAPGQNGVAQGLTDKRIAGTEKPGQLLLNGPAPGGQDFLSVHGT